ncbi:WbuC family cupin fold metalloprotein [Polynucleobacter sp. UB-Tiil-W10]|uniref:WbuC family cupin fold metalloprotein n=1 Tax=Polynucleobacter sp. UB-Tiil-W10 TaxID=1855648 RepID=UPI001C0CC4DB|nr:WbuC family cupin fold metalloprotein [Polynucleobacter sp. UB-Tiil-W10]MBU3540825.1 cupin fold metalloprotein, WbuC family [Polynucleobacter sp. UB-Tiil-W10]
MTTSYSPSSSILPSSASLPLRKVNDEVFMATDEVIRFDSRYVDLIKQSAAKNARGRARICAHRGPSDILHEMLIAIRSDSYIRPHRHHQKVESFHLVDGLVDVVVLNEDGSIADVVELSHQGNFYYRLDLPRYHTLLIHSPVLVIHEITNGPFEATQSDWGSFSPAEGSVEVTAYISQLRKEVLLRKATMSIKES